MVNLSRDGGVYIFDFGNGENGLDADRVTALHDALDEMDGLHGPAALATTAGGRFHSTGLDPALFAKTGHLVRSALTRPLSCPIRRRRLSLHCRAGLQLRELIDKPYKDRSFDQ
jgi:hypothetical protein